MRSIEAEAILVFARQEVDRAVREDLGNNKDSGKRIEHYHEVAGWKGDKAAAYCASFVSYCYIRAGVPIGGLLDGKILKPGTASCWAMAEWFRRGGDKGEALFVRKPLGRPQPGDAIFIDTNSPGPYNHVGLVESYDETTGAIHTIEGNTTPDATSNDPVKGGGVWRRKRNIGASSVVGWGRIVGLKDTHPKDEGKGAAS
jgi:hypothetical protein